MFRSFDLRLEDDGHDKAVYSDHLGQRAPLGGAGGVLTFAEDDSEVVS